MTSTSRLKNKSPVVAIVVFLLVALWTIPTLGLLVTSFRTKDQIATSGWWQAPLPTQANQIYRTDALKITEPTTTGLEAVTHAYAIQGTVFADGPTGEVLSWGVSSRAPNAYEAGSQHALKGGELLTVSSDGSYSIISEKPIEWRRGQRIFVTARMPAQFTLSNYKRALFEPERVDGMLKGLIGTASVAIPSTIIPIMIAAFAAYALAWMQLPWRRLWLGVIIALLVVPLQLSFIPILRLLNEIGLGKSYISLLMAHTGFGLPLAIYLLYNYISNLPSELIQSARVEGANDFQIFTRLIVPLSIPALASFSIFQFLWTWNDLLVARVFFIGSMGENTVMTSELVELLGSRGGDWEILATSAFISMIIPLIVFFSLQRYLVRGLLAGSLK